MARKDRPIPFLDTFDSVLTWFTLIGGGAILIFMTVLGTFNVVLMRKILNAPILGAEDLMILALVLIVAISIPFGGRVGAHIEIEVLESRMSPAFARWSMFILKIVAMGIMGLMAVELQVAGTKASRFGETTQQLLISYEPFYYILSFFVAVYVLVIISDAVQLLVRGEIRQIPLEGHTLDGAETAPDGKKPEGAGQ